MELAPFCFTLIDSAEFKGRRAVRLSFLQLGGFSVFGRRHARALTMLIQIMRCKDAFFILKSFPYRRSHKALTMNTAAGNEFYPLCVANICS